eukprot:UN27911
MADKDIKQQESSSPKSAQGWFVSYEHNQTFERFLNNRIAEYGSQLCFSKSTRWARVDRRYKHVSRDEMPVGLTKNKDYLWPLLSD